MALKIAVLVVLATLLIGWEIRRCGRVRFRRLEIPLGNAGLGAENEISILHLSDLHITAPSAGRLAQLDPLLEKSWDFIMISGDLIDDDSGVAPVCEFIGRLRAGYGKFAVLGNHDYYRVEHGNPLGWLKMFWKATVLGRAKEYSIPNDVESLIAVLENKGVRLMRNEQVSGEFSSGVHYQVFGIDDPSTGRDIPEPLYPSMDPGALRLAITHSPKRIGRIAPLIPALVLCGHTHGGQIRLPLIGALATRSDASRRECGGLVKLDNCLVHISPGFGAGRLFPARFMSRSEVTEIVLRAADKGK